VVDRKRCDAIVGWIGCGWSVVGALVTGFARVHDEGNWGRKAVSYFTLFITYTSLKWSFEYTASQSGKPGLETAAVIGAVMAPIAILQAAIAKFYFEANTRTEQIAAGQPANPPQQVSLAATATTKGV
jgi:hypothetical protein